MSESRGISESQDSPESLRRIGEGVESKQRAGVVFTPSGDAKGGLTA